MTHTRRWLTGLPAAFVGVDLGIADIATTSDGVRYSGKGLNARLRPRI